MGVRPESAPANPERPSFWERLVGLAGFEIMLADQTIQKNWNYAVVDIPFMLEPALSGHDLRRPAILPALERRLLPILLVRAGESVDMPVDALGYSKSRLDKASYAHIRSEISTIGRLYDYRMHFCDYVIEDAQDFDILTASYLHARLTVPERPSDRPIVGWERVGIETAKNDFRAIRRFASFSTTSAPGSLLAQALRPDGQVFKTAAYPKRTNGLLEHLRVKAERWRELVGEEAAFPADLKWIVNRRFQRAARSAIRLSRDEVIAIIECEKNPVLRALWILLAFAGPRISEALNLWICDVLPGNYSRFFAGFVQRAPFVLFCHPFASTYCGKVSDAMGTETREGHLKRYGRKPRVVPDEDTGEVAGWKGMLFFDKVRLLSWATWLDDERASEFSDLIEVIGHLHRSTGSAGNHLYFFINSGGGEYAGNPLRIKRVEQALEATCRRAGVSRGDTFPTPHVFRHFYTDECRELGLADWEIQFCLRHGRVDSQEDYGKNPDNLHRHVTEVMRRRARA